MCIKVCVGICGNGNGAVSKPALDFLWVNKGTKGIALIHSKNGRPYIDYVFDISDTNSFYGNEIKLWEYNEKYNDAIIETLENTFGELSSKLSVVDAVISAAHNAVEDNKADYLSSLKYAISKTIANYERQQMLNEPYLETREKENQFVERIVNEVEKVIENNLPSFILTCIGNLANGKITTEYTAPEEDILNSEDIDWDFIGND